MGERERSELDWLYDKRGAASTPRSRELARALRENAAGLPEGWHCDLLDGGQLALTPPQARDAYLASTEALYWARCRRGPEQTRPTTP